MSSSSSKSSGGGGASPSTVRRRLRRGRRRDALADRRGERLGGAGRGHVDLRRLLAVGAAVGLLEVDDLAQQDLASFSSSRQTMMASKVSALSHRPRSWCRGRPRCAWRWRSRPRATAARPSPSRAGTCAPDRRCGRPARTAGRDGGRRAAPRRVRRLRLSSSSARLGASFSASSASSRLDDVDAHLAEHRVDVLDLLGGDLLRRQDLVQLVHGDVAARLGLLDDPLDGGVRQVEQRAVGGFHDHRFAFDLRLVVSCHLGVSVIPRAAERPRGLRQRPSAVPADSRNRERRRARVDAPSSASAQQSGIAPNRALT